MIKFRIERVYVETENKRQMVQQLQTDLLRSESVADRYMGEILQNTVTLQTGDVRSLCWGAGSSEEGALSAPPDAGSGNSTTNGTTVMNLSRRSQFSAEIRRIQKPWNRRSPGEHLNDG